MADIERLSTASRATMLCAPVAGESAVSVTVCCFGDACRVVAREESLTGVSLNGRAKRYSDSSEGDQAVLERRHDERRMSTDEYRREGSSPWPRHRGTVRGSAVGPAGVHPTWGCVQSSLHGSRKGTATAIGTLVAAVEVAEPDDMPTSSCRAKIAARGGQGRKNQLMGNAKGLSIMKERTSSINKDTRQLKPRG